MLTIMKQDTINLLKNKPIMMYLLIYPVVLILVTGFVFGSIFSDDILTSYDYYGVTMMIYLSMATVIIFITVNAIESFDLRYYHFVALLIGFLFMGDFNEDKI